MDFAEWCEENDPAGEHCFLDDVKKLENMGSYTEKAEKALRSCTNRCLTDKGPVQMAMYGFLEKQVKDTDDLFVSPDAMTTYGNAIKLVQALTVEEIDAEKAFTVSRKRLISIPKYLDKLTNTTPEMKKSLEEAIEEFSKYAFTIGNFTKIPKYPTKKKKAFEKIKRQRTLNVAKGFNSMEADWFPGAKPEEVPEYTNDQFAAFLMYFEHDKKYDDWKKIAMFDKGAEAAYKKAGKIYMSLMNGTLFEKSKYSERIKGVTQYLEQVTEGIKAYGKATTTAATEKESAHTK